ncbi:hypothetical protein Ahy_B04g069318 isoform D [Arachis hypogaea]|uniref:Uncharacterized protein n=1 Tax=Arachis hypogaea TaxID=3818 RepID=A0A444ZC86_ARAHY|nr:hypothetical protein Ahy_B04g069318 isoform D [Arachis hypogaea]
MDGHASNTCNVGPFKCYASCCCISLMTIIKCIFEVLSPLLGFEPVLAQLRPSTVGILVRLIQRCIRVQIPAADVSILKVTIMSASSNNSRAAHGSDNIYISAFLGHES